MTDGDNSTTITFTTLVKYDSLFEKDAILWDR